MKSLVLLVAVWFPGQPLARVDIDPIRTGKFEISRNGMVVRYGCYNGYLYQIVTYPKQ